MLARSLFSSFSYMQSSQATQEFPASADTHKMSDQLFAKYEEFKTRFHGNEGQAFIYDIIQELFNISSEILKPANEVALKSMIPGKEYIGFELGTRLSRAINKNLFAVPDSYVADFLQKIKTNQIDSFSAEDITKICYKIAISFCAAIDVIKSNDQKTPGTYFEYLMGQFFSSNLGVRPRKQVDVLNIENLNTRLPTDYIFDLGIGRAKYHVPVKTSTRERVIQVWAHQKVLDGIYGTGRFLGLLTCLSESKVDHKKFEVTEICLPDQWRIYQLFISQLKRIYYLDLPNKYAEMNTWYPPIHVQPFGTFFKEQAKLLE